MPDFAHLWAEPSPIPLHAIMAMAALLLGVIQMARPKGTKSHRLIGYAWVLLMLGTALSAMFIHTINLWGKFSPIHILIPVTLVALWQGVQAARMGDVKRHKSIMQQLFAFALIVTGLFTLLPGRAMHAVFFGGG